MEFSIISILVLIKTKSLIYIEVNLKFHFFLKLLLQLYND